MADFFIGQGFKFSGAGLPAEEIDGKSDKELVYQFKVSLDKKVYREIALKGATSLYKFAEAIVNSFDFQFDHSFGFYSNLRDTHRSSQRYTLFHDMDDVEDEPGDKSVKHSYVHQVFKPGKKMIFLFDYGDNWHFLVECCSITAPEAGKKYPVVTGKEGTAPLQYPPIDD